MLHLLKYNLLLKQIMSNKRGYGDTHVIMFNDIKAMK